ncbi:MAG: hypothetical protein ACHQT9_02700, partial [Candidatus Saccharimonadales bacterium]
MKYLYPEMAGEVDGGLEPLIDPLKQFAAEAKTLLSGYDRTGNPVKSRRLSKYVGRSYEYGAPSFVLDVSSRVKQVPSEDAPIIAGETEALLQIYEAEGDILGALEMAWTIGEIARQARDWDTAVVYLGHSAHYCAGVSSILESLDLYDG